MGWNCTFINEGNGRGNLWHWHTYMNELWFLQVNYEMQKVMVW